MNIKYLEILVISAILVVILLGLKLGFAHGANSLSELQSEVNNETGYRGELEGYVISNNISFGVHNGGIQLNVSDFDLIDLETLVKSHMKFCQSANNTDERIKYKQSLGNEWNIVVDNKMAFDDC